MMRNNRKPVTLLTGYLGAGKTTVMNRLLASQLNHRIAVIVNDMGSVNIDARLLQDANVIQGDSDMIQLQNGCICCTLRDEFMEQIEQLSHKTEIESILVEASGISNPSAIAEGFLMYQDMHPDSSVYLNSIVTVADADRIYAEFLGGDETGRFDQTDGDIINLVIDQIEFCNLLILNKCDLLSESELEEVVQAIRQIQNDADIVKCVHGNVDVEQILAENSFDYDKVSNSSAVQKAFDREPDINSFVFEERRPFDYDKFMTFLEEDYPEEIIRSKGYIWFEDDDIHVQLFEQAGRNASVTEMSNWIASFNEKGQREVFGNYPEVKEDWDETYGDRLNQIVFIGKDYNKSDILNKIKKCLAE